MVPELPSVNTELVASIAVVSAVPPLTLEVKSKSGPVPVTCLNCCWPCEVALKPTLTSLLDAPHTGEVRCPRMLPNTSTCRNPAQVNVVYGPELGCVINTPGVVLPSVR